MPSAANVAAAPSRSTPTWHARTPTDETLQITRNRAGHWIVLLGSFARSTNVSLIAALAETTGASQQADWLASIADAIEDDHFELSEPNARTSQPLLGLGHRRARM